MKKLLSLAAIAALPSTILTSSNLIRNDIYSPETDSAELRPAVMCGTSEDWGCGYKNTVLVSIDLTQLSLEKVNCIYPGLLDLLDCALDENDEHASLVKYRGHFVLVTLQQNILNIEYPTTREAGVNFRKYLNKCVDNGRMHLYMHACATYFHPATGELVIEVKFAVEEHDNVA